MMTEAEEEVETETEATIKQRYRKNIGRHDSVIGRDWDRGEGRYKSIGKHRDEDKGQDEGRYKNSGRGKTEAKIKQRQR